MLFDYDGGGSGVFISTAGEWGEYRVDIVFDHS